MQIGPKENNLLIRTKSRKNKSRSRSLRKLILLPGRLLNRPTWKLRAPLRIKTLLLRWKRTLWSSRPKQSLLKNLLPMLSSKRERSLRKSSNPLLRNRSSWNLSRQYKSDRVLNRRSRSKFRPSKIKKWKLARNLHRHMLRSRQWRAIQTQLKNRKN